jgi:four helix bundle protein
MRIERFEDLIAWQKAQDIAVEVYTIFSPSKDWGFKDQIQRASVSISNNISEGFNRYSILEYIRFLNIAHTSCNEVKSMCYLAFRLNYLSLTERDKLLSMCNEVSKIINGLVYSLKKRNPKSTLLSPKT